MDEPDMGRASADFAGQPLPAHAGLRNSSTAGNLLLVSALSFRPGTLDKSEDSPDLGVAQGIGKTRHVALIAPPDDRGCTLLDDAEQHLIGMVPGVAALVVRRCGQPTRGKRRAPVRLPFQIRAMARRALIRIDLSTLLDDLRGCRSGRSGTGVMPSSQCRHDRTCEERP